MVCEKSSKCVLFVYTSGDPKELQKAFRNEIFTDSFELCEEIYLYMFYTPPWNVFMKLSQLI